MATLTCSRCKATTEADSIEEGRKGLNHAIGLAQGKPCEDGRAELFLTGKVKETKPKPVKSKESTKTVGNKTKDSFSKE